MASEGRSLDGQGACASSALRNPPLDHPPTSPKLPKLPNRAISSISASSTTWNWPSSATAAAPEATSHSPTPPSAHQVPPTIAVGAAVAAASAAVVPAGPAATGAASGAVVSSSPVDDIATASTTTTNTLAASSNTTTTTATGSDSSVPLSAAAAHASRPQQNGGSMTPDSDMSNHGLLPIVAHSQGPSTYQSPALTPASTSIYSSLSPPPSHSIQNYALPPPSTLPQYTEASYASPAAAAAASAPGARTSLPSMRTIDAIAHHAPPPPLPPTTTTTNGGGPLSPSSMHHTTSPPPPPLMTASSTSSSSSGSLHGASPYPAILSSNYGLAPETMARYATLPHNPHVLLPRAPKKEIKRRTKTGCLTCRKRRIKCDENHPKCNNCIKSKRHCMGYDPIFRAPLRLINTFSDHQGTQIESTSDFGRALLPAPPHSPSGPGVSGILNIPRIEPRFPAIDIPIAPSRSRATAAIPAETQAQSQAANGYISPPTSNGTHPTPTTAATNGHTIPAVAYEPQRTGGCPVSDSNPPPPVTIKTEPSQPPPILPAIPPAQSIPDPRNLSSAPSAWDSSRPTAPPQPYERSPYPPRPLGPIVTSPSRELPIPKPILAPAVKMKVEEIINALGPSPQNPQKMNHSEETFTEITKVYHELYARGLSAFFETAWYFFSDNGKMSFPRDPSLTDNMASFLRILESSQPHDHSYMAYSGVLETRIVWQLAQTALRAASEKTNNAMRVSLPPDGDPIEARNRIHVVETLLSGDYLASNPLTPPLQDEDPVRARQFDFWYHLGEFVRERPEIQPPQTMGARDDILGRLRHLLDGRENRDVLYSIAVVRDLAPLFESNYMNTVPQHLDEGDPKNRLAVASRLILEEAQATGGTSNVVRRFCDIAGRAFVNPGVNVARRI